MHLLLVKEGDWAGILTMVSACRRGRSFSRTATRVRLWARADEAVTFNVAED
ncbi:hypothetical protein [Microvirga yunnanensis]|uniref:hypothetical protein n=1 Tax=Microvirga yunnanensis TaxID=2953740 RepID=UPI0021C7EA72|nr:hypothetical protein [Microvirga sp. HBU65207]